MAVDLVQRLTDAAVASIADLRPDLERDPQSVRGVTVELTVTPGGNLGDAVSYLERRKRVAERGVLDHQSVRAG